MNGPVQRRLCALGAMSMVERGHAGAHRDHESDAVVNGMHRYLASLGPLPPPRQGCNAFPLHNTIADWNNHPKRTKEEVVSALRAAAYFEADEKVS